MPAGARPFELPFAVEDPPGGGPVAGLMAGAARLGAQFTRALVLAVDAPTIQAAGLAPLLVAASPGACFESLPLPLVIAITDLPPEAGAGWSMRRFVEAAGLATRAWPPGAEVRLRGANTPAERAALLAALRSEPG